MGTTNFDDVVLGDLGATSLATLLASMGASEIAVLDAVTPGTVAASKAVVVDANKDIASFRNLTATGTVTTVTLTTTGATAIGDAAGDTVKFHGASAQTGAKSAFGAQVVGTATTQTTPFGFATQAQGDDLVARVNAMLTCLINHGLMAAS